MALRFTAFFAGLNRFIGTWLHGVPLDLELDAQNYLDVQLSPACMAFLSVVLMPASDFFLFCLLPLLLLDDVLRFGGLSFLLGLIGIFVLLGHEIVLAESVLVRAHKNYVVTAGPAQN